jgi:prolyl-tRNA editing enzyme YbaK/EbsC (Cys-tRNA(Pro) deacylase)
MHPNTVAVQAALFEAGVATEVQVLSASTRTASEAASALGCEVGAIANSLIFSADSEPVLVLASGSHRVDTALLAGQIGATHIDRATADEVRVATGQPIGGVSPLGHPAPLPTYIDVALADYQRLWAAAGTPRAVFSTSYDELRRICRARSVIVAEE